MRANALRTIMIPLATPLLRGGVWLGEDPQSDASNASCTVEADCDWMQNFKKNIPFRPDPTYHGTTPPDDSYYGISGGPWPAYNAHSWMEAGTVMGSHTCCVENCGDGGEMPEGQA